MSFIDNILDKMGLSDDYDDDDFYGEEYTEEPPVKGRKAARDNMYDDYDDEYERKTLSKGKTVKPATNAKVTPISGGRTSKKNGVPEGMEVCVIKPTTVEDAREITETLLNGRTVVLNLEGLDIEIAQRIIDFTSGSCFAMSGNLQKISSYIFIITPNNVDIFGDFQDILNGTINVSALRGDI